ncbi:MAG: LamG domain-containing protein, partial [Phycisphaeraceae bacterium]|nr:LamG domain-containing protein [Phycisphaeraceae bacterium]
MRFIPGLAAANLLAAALIVCFGQAAMAGEIPAEPTPFNGKPYQPVWRSFKKSFLQANVDSHGRLSITAGGLSQAPLSFGLQGMESGNFWQTAEVRNLTASQSDRSIVTGKVGNGFRFDRFPLDLGVEGKYRFTTCMSMAAWIKPARLGGIVVVNGLTKGPNFYGEDHLYSLEVRPDGSLWFELTDTTGKRHIHNPLDLKLTTDAWQHVAATYDGTFMRVYVNGQEAGVGREDKDIRIRDTFPNGRPLLLGEALQADLDEVRLYGRALSSREIKALADGKPLPSAEGDLEQGLVLNCSFDDQQTPAWSLTSRDSFEIKGTISNGTQGSIVATFSISGDTVACRYSANMPLVLQGTFQPVPEANWFKSKSENGSEIQGELWGEYQDLKLFNLVEYTLLERRIRLMSATTEPLTLKPCKAGCQPATFTLASRQEGESHVIDFTFQSLDPAQAPLANPQSPVVTKPFDRRKLTPLPPVAEVEFVPQKGKPAIFRRDEKLAFRMTLAEQARKRLDGKPLEIRCVQSLTGSVHETLALKTDGNGACAFELKSVAQGPYRIELWSEGNAIASEEFAVVGPVEQRKIGPLETRSFKLREVDRIDCADDNGRHEFYALSPQHVKIHGTPGLGKHLAYEAPIRQGSGYGDPGHEWFAYRVNNLATDKPHLLVVEYPDIDDMNVGINVMHPYPPKDVPVDKDGKRIITAELVHAFGKDKHPAARYLTTMTCGYVAGQGFPLTGKRQTMQAVFYPGDDWAVIQFDNFSYINPKPIRISRLTVHEILDDLPMVEAPHLANDRIVGHYDEWLRDPTRNFAAAATMRGEIGVWGNCLPSHVMKTYYVTAERMVKYLRFRGENTWFGGVVRYSSAMYPSEMAQGTSHDELLLYASMFEENGLTLVPSVAYVPAFPLRLLDRYTSYDAAQGADATLQITDQGSFSYMIWGRGRSLNPFHPAVRKEVEGLAGEIAGLYKDYPAVRGVMFANSLNTGYLYPSYFGPCFVSLPPSDYDFETASFRSTYDDRTIAAFVSQTGIQVPGDGPGRFAERRRWLLANHKEAWADFRCQGIADAWDGLAKAVQQACPRMEFFACESGGIVGNSASVAYVQGPDSWTARNIMRKMGYSALAPRKPDHSIVGCYFNEMNGGYVGFWGLVRADQIQRFNAMNWDSSLDELFDGNDRVGVYMGRSFYESWSRPYPQDRPWYTSKVHSCRYQLPGNRGG